MKHVPVPLTRDLVLIGGGHSHALVLRSWGMDPLPGVRLTLINPGPTAPYSGMLPGHIAGHYDRAALDIDLVKLARFAGARLILGTADGIDRTAQQVHVPGRPPIGYDVLAVDIGITSAMPALPGFSDHAVPAKPLGPFAARWRAYLDHPGTAEVVVIGAGVAGVELAMAMAHALAQKGRAGNVTLVEAKTALSATSAASRRRILAAMQEQGVTLIEGARITEILADRVILEDGRKITSHFTTGAAGARAHGWLAQTGLDLENGFITVGETLQSSDPMIFASGDCAHMTHDPRPKAGVYAVRQAPVLLANLNAALSGGQMRPYHPQKDYLKLISLGQKSALGERFGKALSGAWMWRWKDHIDQSFMNKFRDLPRMPAPAPEPRAALGVAQILEGAPLCGGCGAKLGRSALRQAISARSGAARDDIIALPSDDAALITLGGQKQVISTDHLRALMPDAALMTRIALIHALGDIWAMGAKAQAATINLILPRLSPALQQRSMDEIMHVADDILTREGAALIGGHSSIGDELTIGFTLTGLCDAAPITLAGARPGDALILTKPIGSGVIMAAEMRGLADGDRVAQAYAQMIQPQRRASEILSRARAMTDVTGFGLAGHLLNICEASQCGATLTLGDIPMMQGALDLARRGVRSSLFEDNRAALPDLPESPAHDLLLDPQTAGGLLAALPDGLADAALADLRNEGFEAARIGHITNQSGVITVMP